MLQSRRNLVLACTLSGLAGYVDGIGFLHLGGLFVSFMSGNSTRLGVMAAEMDWPKALQALQLIAVFVVGAGTGSLIGTGRGANRQWVLLPEAEIGDLIVELRSATAGVGSFVRSYDHMAEVNGRAADQIIAAHRVAA